MFPLFQQSPAQQSGRDKSLTRRAWCGNVPAPRAVSPAANDLTANWDEAYRHSSRCLPRWKQWTFFTAAILARNSGVNTGVPKETNDGSVPFWSNKWNWINDTCSYLQFLFNMAVGEKRSALTLRLLFCSASNFNKQPINVASLTIFLFHSVYL